MFSSESVHLKFDASKPAPHRGWVKYFVAALGLGMGAVQAQEQKLLDYWWVMPREEVQNAPRVIRAIGAKGEKFEEVYAEEQASALRGSSAIMQARLERQAALRLEAQQRARELREAGKSPAVAYEEAWAEVYSRRWLNADWRVGSSKLEDMLTRMASDNEDFALTEEEQQWVLEALLEDDDRLESAEGIELLRNLARRLRSMGYGKSDVTAGVNDELMMRFADAMRHGKESMAAYRNALFTTHRDRVMHHELRGYVAPWGMGAGGTRSYRQAPVALTPSAGTGNTHLKRPAPLTITSEYMEPVLMAQQEFDIAEILPGEDVKDLGSAEPAPHLLQQQVPRVEVAFSGRDTTSAYSAEVLAGAADSGMLQVQSTPQSPVTPSLPMVATSTYSAPGLNDLPGALADFRATAPAPVPNEESVEGAEEDKDKEETDEDTDAGIAAAAPSMMMRSFAMRAVAAVAQNEGGAGTSGTPDSPVQGGVIELSPQESIDVGANRITAGGTGGRLENVQMLVTGEISRPVTGDYVTVHNLVSSANGSTPGILSGVTLYAGTATEYASLHNIAFAGESSLTGFVTFEKTQATGDMSVAAGGTLTLKNLTFDLRGVSMGEKTLFVIEDGGTLENWNADNVHFVYSGVKVNSAAVDLSKGVGKIELSADHNGHLYWNGADDNMWNISSANWSSSGDGTGREAFTALSNVHFGGGNAANREISVTQDMVVANLDVTDGGYSFSGARVAVLGDASLNPGNGAVTFNDQLVVQGSLAAEGSGSVKLLGGATVVNNAVFENLSTTIGGDMTVGGKLTVSSGDATTAGSLTIAGNVTAQVMELAVHAGSGSSDLLVDVSGNLSVGDDGLITIGGTAKQQYTGTVTAGNLIVNTQENDVIFSYLQVGKLTVGEGATVHVQSSSDSVAVSSSVFPVVDLSGTLALDAPGVTYNDRHKVNVMSDAARLVFGEGSTIADLQIFGKQDNTGSSSYTDVDIEVNSRSATVTSMKDLGTLTVNTGSLTVQNAQDAVHGDLILDKGKLKLGAGSDNIMASDSGAVCLQHGSSLDIGSTTQTLYARNEAESLSLSGASTITSEADGGLSLGDGIIINYKDSGNSIETKLTAEKDFTLNSTLAGSSLEISGHISGSGNMNLTGKGIVVLYGANTGYTGTVTVDNGSTLTLLNADSLLNAGVVLGDGGTLSLNAPDAVTLKALTFSNGSTLAISSIVGTQKASTADAVLNTTNGVTFGQDDVVLNLIFSHELDTMKTYNIMTGVTSVDKLRLNVQHNGVELDNSQYKVDLGSDGLLYITTMMGNVWDGESSQYWTKSGNGKNWSGDEYREDVLYKAAIFRDLTTDGSTQASETVTVQGTVNPGDIYFTADTTSYTLDSDGAGGLDAGTSIHKLGKADVSLNLSNNATADTALGNVDVQAGSLILGNDFAVKGTVTVEKDANLKLKDGSGGLNMVAGKDDEAFITYSVSTIGGDASLSGVTMDAAGIRGVDKESSIAAKLLVQGNAHLADLTLKNFEAKSNEKGNVTLSDVILTSSSSTATTLTDVTIGSGVKVDASGSYILSGNLTFDSALTNNGTVTLANVTNIEIGKITPTEDAGQYEYTFINGGTYQFIGSSGEKITSDMVSINGVKLSGGLASGITAVFTDNKNGSFTLSFTGDTVGMPQWDERWGKTENAPSLSRRYTGTDEKAYVELAAGAEQNTNYYRYSSIVDGANAAKVNNGKAIVVTLSEGATGNYAVGGLVKADRVTGDVYEYWHYVHNIEVWIDDRSSIKNIIGGLDNALNNEWGYGTSAAQSGATHVLVEDPDYQKKDSIPNDYRAWDKSYVIAGSRWCNQTAESFVTVRSGEIYNVFGGSCGGHYGGACYEHVGDWESCKLNPDKNEAEWWDLGLGVKQSGTSHVYVEGGRIGEIFAGGVYADLDVGVGNRAVEMVLTGGDLGGADLRVFGGSNHGNVTGDIYIRMEGSAQIKSRLLGGSNAGTVNGDIVLDLISGSAYRVDAAGLGWYQKTEYPDGSVYIYDDPASIKGDVLVNLYKDFELGIGADGNLSNGIYGGREQSNNIILLKGDDGTVHTSTLHFAEGEKYAKLASIVPNGYDTSENSIIVTGFDRFELEDKAHVVLGLGLFDVDMDPSKELVISGKGVVEVIGHGVENLVLKDNYGKVIKSGESRNLGRNIRLEGGSTLMISTGVIGAAGSEDDRTITVTDGTTIDFSGFSLNSDYERDAPFDGLGFNVYICGHGVDGQGAIYKGSYEDTRYPSTSTIADRIILPKVWLTDSASVNVEAAETLHMNAYVNPQKVNDSDLKDLDLGGNTFTKFGAGDFITHRVDMTPGTILVQQGTFGFDQTGKTDGVDMVLAAGAELKLNATALETADPTDLSLRSLSGAGTVELNGSTLTLYTDKGDTNKGVAYYEEYMTDVYTGDASSYDQFSEVTGFGYAVFSGLIKDGSGGKIAKSGSEVHYISGSSNTYTGGTQLQGGRLYLLGTSEASTFTKDTSKAAAGVAGTGTIVWDSANAELYLGHGTRIYNNGTTSVQSGTMTIGVEAVTSSVLADFVGIHGTVTMGGVEYVEIDTHNLKSIDVAAVYADGTAYAAGTDIDRNKMLLVKASDWDASKSKSEVVTRLSATGYNEATYSGVLSGDGGLSKVGLGTLDLDQTNSYTGKTLVEEGTLRLRGWGTVGSDAVHVAPAASLMLAYTGGYGSDETDGLANDIYLSGTGDAQWLTHDSTDGRAAALISAVGRAVTFILSGNIHDADGELYSGAGGVLHSGEGTLVLCGDSSYTGGTVITRGVVEVQSAEGLGATAEGQSAVVLNAAADLHLTVEDPASTEKQLVTKLASAGDDIQGDVRVTGNKNATERVLHMADNGYNAAYTTLDEKGTFLLCGTPIDGAGIHSHSAELTGSGTVVVSDATGSGTTATFDTITDYSGDFRVEGDKASIQVKYGTYSEGSIAVSGQQASVQIGGNVSIEAGESLQLSSTGVVPAQTDKVDMGTGAVLVSHGMVSVAAGAELSASKAETVYAYDDISELEKAASVTVEDVVLADDGEINAHHQLKLGDDVPGYYYNGRFDADIAINQQAVAGVKADVGLTLAGGSSYKTDSGHISLMGGSLTLDTLTDNQLTFNTTLDVPYETLRGDVQLVLFSDVSSVKFIYGDITETAKEPGVYYTRADNFLTGCDYIDSQTMLVYDSHADVVYLQMKVPEPTTSTLGLLALTALCARRRRR